MNNSSGLKMRLLLMLGFAAFSVISYYTKTQVNPVTGEKQRVSLTPDQEVAMGLQSAPQMAAEFGGELNDINIQSAIKKIGNKLVAASDAKESPYRFDFHVLADPNTINAFALPGGQIFITMGLLKRLQNESEIAGVLGHEVGHVINRHSAEHMAKAGLFQGLVNSVMMGSGDMTTGQIAGYVANMVNLKYGRDDELESDKYGIKYMVSAGYQPEAMLRVMEVLAEAGGGKGGSDFGSSHPSPENRIIKIKEEIAKMNGGR
jgi:predicted Zn-dependent protease